MGLYAMHMQSHRLSVANKEMISHPHCCSHVRQVGFGLCHVAFLVSRVFCTVEVGSLYARLCSIEFMMLLDAYGGEPSSSEIRRPGSTAFCCIGAVSPLKLEQKCR